MLKQLKPIELEPPTQDEKSSFTLDTVAGRDSLAERIEKDIDLWCQKQYDDGPRSHLGASIIGHECERYLWFAFHWMFYEVFSGRMQRLFQRGHLEEDRVIEWLRGIGFIIKQTEVFEDSQQRIVFAEGHGGGSLDGTVQFPERYGKFEPILLEIKTQKDKKFNLLQGSGVQKEKPMHYIQASTYGRQRGLRYCLYIAVNKEDDDLDIEVIELDWSLAEAHIARAEKIIDSRFAPPRMVGARPEFFKCKFCPALNICFFSAPVTKNCRSCFNSRAVSDGQWHCGLYNSIIPKEYITQGCEAWQPLPTK
jgi:hypothetical protein